MKLFLNFVAILVVCVVVSAQEREGSDDNDRQTVQGFQRPTVLNQKPIRRLVSGIRERVKEGSARVVNRFQSIIEDVRQRTQQLEQNFKDQLLRLRPQAVDANKRLKALEEQKKELTQKIKVVTNEFEDKRDEYRSALKQQKDVLDNQIRVFGVKDPAATTDLEKESKDIDEQIEIANKTPLVPQPRGLGDGYGRHL